MPRVITQLLKNSKHVKWRILKTKTVLGRILNTRYKIDKNYNRSLTRD